MSAPAASESQIKSALERVIDPELKKSLVELRWVKSIGTAADAVNVVLELPTPAYLHKQRLLDETKAAVAALPGVETATVEATFNVGRSTRVVENNRIPSVKNVIAVAAGKGGVGKSTVATNLALALRAHGATVGLLDADVYGPSVPTMLGEPDVPPGQAVGQKIVPAVHYGIRVMSIGFFVEREGAVVWRGPMVHKLLQQFLEDVDWGPLDYLVMDLPPGTGDAQLSLSQLIPVTGAVMVTTPQEVALIDVVKAVSMFKKVEIPILGVIENMSGYVCPACGHHDDIFSRGGGQKLAKELGAPFLGELPIDAKVRFGGDAGRPVVVGAPESEHAKRFMDIAAQVATSIAVKLASGPKRPAGLVQIR